MDWFRQIEDWLIARGAPRGVRFGLYALAALWLWLFYEVFREVWVLTDGTAADTATASDTRERIQALFFVVAILGALLTAIVVPVRLLFQYRLTLTAEQGLITDRLTKAVEQLGAEKTVYRDGQAFTEPNLEVRLGAIYALERIAQDSERDHIPVMETFCAYVRQNAKLEPPKRFPLFNWIAWVDPSESGALSARQSEIDLRRTNMRQWTESLGPCLPPRADVAAVLAVFGRRSGSRQAYEQKLEFRLDLRRANLQRLDLYGVKLGRADLRDARLEGANLSFANLDDSLLTRCRMDGSNLSNSSMNRSVFFGSSVEGAITTRISFEKSDLRGAQFYSCFFTAQISIDRMHLPLSSMILI